MPKRLQRVSWRAIALALPALALAALAWELILGLREYAALAAPAGGAILTLLAAALAVLVVALERRHRRAQEDALHLAQYDLLTDLPNRTLFHDRLAQALNQARRRGAAAGVMFVDLDRFKSVNDLLGHAAGDALLREAARRLARSVRSADTAARVGGDEFAVVLSEIARPEDASVVARKILEEMALPMRLDGHEITITVSIGIATFPADGEVLDALVRNADAAMFRAKASGRNAVRFYTAAMNEQAAEKLLLENDLRRAIERGEFALHFQPKLKVGSGRIAGLEALLRWQRPGRGLVPPAEFVPLLEESGLIVPAGDWVVQAACAQLQAWRRAGLEPAPVAVNVSAKQLMHRDFAGIVEHALAAHGIEPALLEVEITETAAMHGAEEGGGNLGRLRALGVRIVLDGFGAGYSSLGYLKQLPLDALKLDRSFLSGVPASATDVAIARGIIAMAHSLGLRVIAEGVETEAQRAFLAENGCDEMQGYLLARPLPGADSARLLEPAKAAAPLAQGAPA